MTTDTADRQRHLARNTMLVAGSFALAAGVGLVRNMAIARFFGIGPELDAYYAAFKLPDLLFTIVAGGALATAFIPVFADFLAADDRKGAWRLASAITNLVVLIVSALAVVAGILAPWLVRSVIVPGFEPALQAQTANLMRLVLVSTVVFGISAVQGSVLHGFKHFLLPALAPVAYPLGVIGGSDLPIAALGHLWPGSGGGHRRGVAPGHKSAGPDSLRFSLVARARYSHAGGAPGGDLDGTARPRLGRVPSDPAGHDQPRLAPGRRQRQRAGVGMGCHAIAGDDHRHGHRAGGLSHPGGAGGATATSAGLRGTLGDTLRAMLAFTVPAAVGLIVLGRPLLQLLYQRGQFDAAATEAVYVALRFYALGLVGHACLEVAARAFFAQQDTVTPLIIAAGSAALNIALGLILMGPLGHGGLALANSIAISLEVLVLLYVLRRRWGGIEGRRTLMLFLRAVAASAVMAGVVLGVLSFGESADWSVLLLVALGGGAGGIVYVGLGLLLGVDALRWPLRALQRAGQKGAEVA